MEEKAPIRSAMVSRLPKFGGRSSAGGTSPLPNGSTQPTTPTQDNKTAHSGTRPNGMIRTSPFSLKWRRDYGTSSSGPTSPGEEGEDKAQPQLPSLVKEVKNGPPGTPKIRRAGTLTVAVSSPKAIPKQSLKLSPKVGTKLNGELKINQNGCSVPAHTGSESRLTRPRLGCSSPRSISQDSLSQSSDSLKTLALDNMVRSNSFTHFKQIPSPTNPPMTRSFSFNRAVELAKPLTNTQLRPPRSSFLKPPQLSNGKVSLGLGGLSGSLGGSGGQSLLHYSRTPPAASSLPMPLITSAPSTPSALKKPLLPSSVLTKPLGSIGGSLGFRMARSKQANQQKPLFPDRAKDDVGSSAATECGSLLGLALDIDTSGETENVEVQSDSDGSSRDGGGSVLLTQSLGHAAGETLEDMSLSSVSSLDRGDTSEELLDDLDSLGDVLSDGEMPDNRTTGSTTQTQQNSCPNAPSDWNAVDVAEDKEESPMQDSQGPLVMSPQHGGAPLASSVELSPSNSSGGTYMWDEEGFEPLPGPGTHPLDSFNDSELNSMDILNNLDPLGSGELDDDDLMLDVDLPEDGVHDADGMSCTERPERAGRPGQRRRHPRWGGPSCRGSRAQVLQHYGDLKAPRMTLDEVTLQHVTQDCSSLKNQLLKLKALLKLEDTDSPADVPEETEDGAAASRLQELIQEVQALRGELRSRDRTIAQLTLQCQQLREQQHQQVRCQCHQQRAPSSLRRSDRQADRRLQHQCDKATQTCGRAANHAPQILQPFNPSLSEHPHLGRLVRTPPTAGHSDLRRTRSEDGAPVDAARCVGRLVAAEPTNPNEPGRRPACAAPQGATARDSPTPATQYERRGPAGAGPAGAGPFGPPGPRTPQQAPPQRVSLPALRSAGAGGWAPPRPGCSLGPPAGRTKQLPPPSRGLPCFGAGPQVQASGLCHASLHHPRRAGDGCRRPQSTDYSLEEPKDPGSASALTPLSRSSIPKAKESLRR